MAGRQLISHNGDMNTMTRTTQRLPQPVRRAMRVILGLAAGIALAMAAIVFMFLSLVAFTGCFISCADPDPMNGALALVGATATATSALLVAAWALTAWRVQKVIRLAPATAACLFGIGLVLVVVTINS